MRPFSPHLRLRRDPKRPDRLVVQSDVPLRVHALTLAVGAAVVVLGHGVGQLLAPYGGTAAQVAAPALALLLAAGAWLALPSMLLTTHVGRDLVEVRRSRRKPALARLLHEEILAIRLAAPIAHAAAAPWRLADRQVELVTGEGSETVAIARAAEARALAKGLSLAVKAPMRDDTPEAEASFCLQQALLAMGRFDSAAEAPEGFALRAALQRGWLVLEIPARSPGVVVRAALVVTGALLVAAPLLLQAWPRLEKSEPLAIALLAAGLAWLASIVVIVMRTQRPMALAASPLGVKITRGRLLGAPTVITLPPPVIVRRRGHRIELAGEARVTVSAGGSDRDLRWAATAIESLAGRPLVPVEDPTESRARAR